MKKAFDSLPFQSADILLPTGCDLQKWAVVACDQYTSQPEYWERVERFVGGEPSALHLVLPESSLDGPDVENDITEINETMTRYLRAGRFRELPDALIYVERTLSGGAVRRGLVGKVDLEAYDYEEESRSPIRATEGTVFSRIPPRVAVRKNAPIELPHVMLLCDDPQQMVLEPLAKETGAMEPLYDFELMENSGHLKGWLLNGEQKERVANALHALQGTAEDAMLFAVGDGNHSLATARECFERQKRITPPEQWDSLPARWALVEVCNLHDPALVFTPIHRVVFDVEPQLLIKAFAASCPDAYIGEGAGIPFAFCHGGERGTVIVPDGERKIPAAILQDFLDAYLLENGGRVDYVHGEDTAEALSHRLRTVAFFLPALDKKTLFPAIKKSGPLPRKTFSVGRAEDKRFYLEARRIR